MPPALGPFTSGLSERLDSLEDRAGRLATASTDHEDPKLCSNRVAYERLRQDRIHRGADSSADECAIRMREELEATRHREDPLKHSFDRGRQLVVASFVRTLARSGEHVRVVQRGDGPARHHLHRCAVVGDDGQELIELVEHRGVRLDRCVRELFVARRRVDEKLGRRFDGVGEGRAPEQRCLLELAQDQPERAGGGGRDEQAALRRTGNRSAPVQLPSALRGCDTCHEILESLDDLSGEARVDATRSRHRGAAEQQRDPSERVLFALHALELLGHLLEARLEPDARHILRIDVGQKLSKRRLLGAEEIDAVPHADSSRASARASSSPSNPSATIPFHTPSRR
ncbi:MAG: hypothetical protein M3Y87_22015 [Myxococcota bacterium]|nr:hypothetical protein [Myxococcota bacterium]